MLCILLLGIDSSFILNCQQGIRRFYVGPHLDYGDIVYHRYDPEMLQGFRRNLEKLSIWLPWC